VSDDFKLDVRWWSEYLPQFNGVSLIPAPHCAEVGSILVTDACPTGCGGFSYVHKQYFHKKKQSSLSNSSSISMYWNCSP
jgi:hypothetical protein